MHRKIKSTMKKNRVISFVSIASFDDDEVQRHYQTLWKNHGDVIGCVNFQFHAYDERTKKFSILELFRRTEL